MAIDDNASYELTGYQVKDLAQKIRAKADSASLASVATSGLYSDLTGAPTIPTVYNGTLTIQQNGTTIGTFSANQDTNETINITGGGGASYTAGNGISIDANNEISVDTTVVATQTDLSGKQDTLTAGTNVQINNNVISATDTTYSDFTGATASTAGAHGLVPAPAAGDEGKALHGDGTWKDTTAKLVEMSYGESNAWTKFINAYAAGSIVYCRASSNSNPATGTQGRKAFMAYVNNAENPTEVEFQYVRSVNSKTDSQQSDQVFIYKLTNASGGTWTVTSRNMAPKVNVSGPITKTFTTGSNPTVTIGADTMTGATSSSAGTAGVVPAPAAGSQDKFLRGDGTWAAAGGSNGRITLYTSPGLSVYDPGDTITLYKDAAETQQITTLQELGALVDSGIVVIRNRSNQDWTLKFWDDDSTSGWYGIGIFVADGGYGEQYRMVWDPSDGDVLKLSSVTYFLTPSSYSTSEASTSEKWIDGKTIYRKTVNFGALPNATSKSVAHNISSLSSIIKMEGVAAYPTNVYIPMPFSSQTAGGDISLNCTATDVVITTGNDRSGASAYVTIYYTKS